MNLLGFIIKKQFKFTMRYLEFKLLQKRPYSKTKIDKEEFKKHTTPTKVL